MPAPGVDAGMDLCHVATARLNVAAACAFAFLIDPQAISRWSLGCMELVPSADGLYRGTSLFDGAEGWIRIDADPLRLAIDYHVGTCDDLRPRIAARVIPGVVCGLGARACYVSLLAWRPGTMSDERWQRLRASHEAEIWLIKAQAECRFAEPA